MPEVTIEVTAQLVRDLLRDQHPDLADHPLRLGARGWDNQMWRLGDDLAVRLPWATAASDELLRREYAYVPVLAPRLPLPVPVPLRFGEPSDRFPRPWLITTWIPGAPGDLAPVTRGAESLAAFLTALHRPAPEGAPAARDRGAPLADNTRGFSGALAAAAKRGLIDDLDAVQAVWHDAVAAPAWTGPPLWIHADLHPANVLTTDGALGGVIDFGALCAGDPAVDLAAAWSLLPDGDGRDRFHAAYRPALDVATRRRARAGRWAGPSPACSSPTTPAPAANRPGDLTPAPGWIASSPRSADRAILVCRPPRTVVRAPKSRRGQP